MTAAQLDRRLFAYSLTAGAVVAGTAAGAAVVYTNLDPDVVLDRAGAPTSYLLDMDGNGTPEFNLDLDRATWSYPSNRGTATGANPINLSSGGGTSGPGTNFIMPGSYASGGFARALLFTAPISGAGPGASGWTSGWPHMGRRSVGSTGTFPYPTWRPWGPYTLGPWHGRGERFLGVAIRIGGEIHHGWVRCTLAADFSTMTIHDYAYEDVPGAPILAGDTGNNIATPGRALQAAAADANIPGGQFTSAPKIFGIYTDPIKDPGGLKPKKASAKVLDKPSEDDAADSVGLEWVRKVRLFDPKGFKDAYKAGTIAAEQPLTQTAMPINLQLTSKQLADPKTPVDIPDLALAAPTIAGVFDEFTQQVTEAMPGDEVVVRGALFGQKPPRVWMEYRVDGVGPVKMLKLKLVKAYDNAKGDPRASIYKYANAAGKLAASVMDPANGVSEFTVLIPEKLPKGWVHKEEVIKGDRKLVEGHDIVIDNGVGIATTPFNTLDPDMVR